ncbi:MAG: hypothetical protein A2087_10070 [Spirochaetes bacterium GWD1_61_31]|nr:MAG: hypothetical protein A2Y37_01890 [Spirochaetes bacterium GWB1_60_80]OHD40625.1 MAG: hypothetical protein A2087_10070 [Spirochaetes bacterium GWD1_61_31]OHD43897.1 MAG: hypothetical protein A2Y35_12420 [Spirochaetes bacterium GWE1_60_18]
MRAMSRIWLAVCLLGLTAAGLGASGEAAEYRDAGGNLYGTVQLGTQVWMTSNYRCAIAGDGTALIKGGDVRGGSIAARYYNFEVAGGEGVETNPVFYNWPGAQAAVPSGWHIPSEAEWETLLAWLALDGQGGPGTDAVAKLLGPDSSSGLDFLYSGSWDAGSFFARGTYASFWTSTQYPRDARDMWQYRFAATGHSKTWLDKRCAFSLRLVRD